MKMNILIIGLSLMASSVYARPDCPEAGFSEEQKAHVKELRQDFKSSVEGLSREERRTAWSEFHQTVLDTIPETDEQKWLFPSVLKSGRIKSAGRSAGTVVLKRQGFPKSKQISGKRFVRNSSLPLRG